MEGRPYLVGTIVGAVLGGAVGYLWSTRGERLSLERARKLIDQVTGEMQHARSLWLNVRAALGDYHEERRRAYRAGVFDVVDFDSQAGVR
jgi:hypothetical protein